MKKLLLLAGMICFAFFSADAQILYSENFPTATMPAGWHQQNASYTPTNMGWVFGSAYVPSGGYLYYYWPTDGSTFAYVNDADNNSSSATNHDTLYSSSFSTSGYAHVFVSISTMYYQASETANLNVSTDGGVTWNSAGSFYGVGTWTTETFNISTLAGNKPNVMIAISYADNGNWTWGLAVDNISVFVPQAYDLAATSQNQTYLVQVGTPYTLTGVIHNYGGDSIVSMHMNYKVVGSATVTQSLTGISGFNGNTDYNFSCSTPWTPAATQNYTVKFWADNLNGANVDQNHANDTLVAYFMAVDSMQIKKVMLEEFMQASCNPCMLASPNWDAVARAVCYAPNIANIVRYHVNWPGTDYMNNETQTPFISNRVSYYAVGGVPDGKIDGADFSPSSIMVSDVQTEHNVGSPFKITIDSASYNPTSRTFTATAVIKSYGNFASGLKCQAVLTVDTITYLADQSTENPKSSFAPPIGTGTTADSMYQYVMSFPNVAEDMMPTSAGTNLSAFTPLSTQTVTVSWTKNHPWGSSPATYKYDSLGNHITFFIQTNSAITAAGVPTQYVFQSASAHVKNTPGPSGMQELTNGVSYEMYPNPANNMTNIAFKLDNEQNVSVEVYNMLGEKVASVQQGTMSAGSHIIPVNTSTLESGIYIVKFIADGTVTNSKLVIQR